MNISVVSEHVDFLRNMITSIIKGIEYYKGTLYQSTLYILAIDGVLYTVDVSSFFPIDIHFDFERKSKETLEIYVEPTTITNEVLNVAKKINYFSNNFPKIYHEPNLRSNENFEKIVTAKSSDGSERFYIDTDLNHSTFMILYRNIFNLTKQDKVALQLYNLTERKILAEFTLYKKKINLNINIYFIFADMIN